MEKIENSQIEQSSTKGGSKNLTPPQAETSFLKKLKTKWPIVLGALGSITLFIVLVYVAYSYSKKGTEVLPAPTATPILTTTPLLTLTPTQEVTPSPLPTGMRITIPPELQTSGKFSKRQYDSSENFFFTAAYPKEILGITENELLSIKCTPRYIRSGEKSEFPPYDPFNTMSKEIPEKYVKLKDTSLSKLAQEIDSFLANKKVEAITLCAVENNRFVLEYETWGGLAGSENTAYFGLIDTDGSVKQMITLSTGGRLVYFVCTKPLQLTTANQLYYGCGGADGTWSAESIYLIDFNTKTSEVIIKCITTGECLTFPCEPEISCESRNTGFNQKIQGEERIAIEELIAAFEEGLNLAEGSTHTQEKFFSFFTEPKTQKEQEEKSQLFCEGAFPCLWVSTSSLAGVSRYEFLGLEKIADGQYKAEVKEWVIRYSAPDGKYVETDQRRNYLVIIKEDGKWLIDSYGTNTKYMGIYAD